MKSKIAGLLVLVILLFIVTSCSNAVTPVQDKVISLLDLSGVSAPVKGETPVTSIDSMEYTGSVSWSPEVSSTFAPAAVYTAVITLTPKTGYTLSGVKENSFTVSGAETCTNATDSGSVNAVFPATAAASDKAITSFSLNSPEVSGVIDESSHTIRMKVPADTNTSALIPSISHTGISINPASGVSNNFSSPVQYTVTAEDGTTQVYTVMVVPLPAAPEMLINRDFTFKDSYWEIFQGNGADSVHDFSSGSYVISGSLRGTNYYDVGIQQRNLKLDKYSIYEISFDANSTNADDVIPIVLEEGGIDRDGDGSTYTCWSRENLKLSTTTQRYTVRLLTKEFDDASGVITFFFGGSTSGTITLDNISLKKTGTWTPPAAPEMLYNGDFTLGSTYWNSWNEVTSTSGSVGDFSDGKFTLADPGRGTEDWHLQLNTEGYLNFSKGQSYTITFEASSTEEDTIRLNAGESGTDVNGDSNNYTDWKSEYFSLSETMTAYTMTFTMPSTIDDPNGRLNFCIGNTSGTITIDNVSVKPAD